MAADDQTPLQPLLPGPGVTSPAAASTEATNARMLNEVVGKLVEATSSGNADVITALNAIATAITDSLIGGTTGTNANRLLVSKGTGGRALQPTQVTLDPSAAGFAAAAIAFTATQRVLGRNSASAGAGEEVTLTQLLDWISASVARGDLLRRGASGWERVALGSSGQVLTSDGTDPNWANSTANTLSAIRVYTANDTWSKPAGIAYVIVHVIGGGGDAQTGNGGTSSFGSHCSATGGTAAGGAGGTGSNGDINQSGGAGYASAASDVGIGGDGAGPFGGKGGVVAQAGSATGKIYGGGGAAIAVGAGISGGGGGSSMKRIAAGSLGSTETVTVGAAGGSGGDAGAVGGVIVFEYTT